MSVMTTMTTLNDGLGRDDFGNPMNQTSLLFDVKESALARIGHPQYLVGSTSRLPPVEPEN